MSEGSVGGLAVGCRVVGSCGAQLTHGQQDGDDLLLGRAYPIEVSARYPCDLSNLRRRHKFAVMVRG